jgi:hypothetical protein
VFASDVTSSAWTSSFGRVAEILARLLQATLECRLDDTLEIVEMDLING